MRACCKVCTLQQALFLLVGFGKWIQRAFRECILLFFGMAKAALRVLTAVCCLFGVCCRSGSFFLGIMGFQPSFFLLHPPLLEVEA